MVTAYLRVALGWDGPTGSGEGATALPAHLRDLADYECVTLEASGETWDEARRECETKVPAGALRLAWARWPI